MGRWFDRAFYLLIGLLVVTGVLISCCQPARADGLYVQGRVLWLRSWQSTYEPRFAVDSFKVVDDQVVVDRTSVRPTVVSFGASAYDLGRVCNPYGVAAVGYDWRWPRWVLNVEARHQSGACADRGEDSLSVGVTWYPFGQM